MHYVDNGGSNDLFESPVLKAIVQHKWDSVCRTIFLTRFGAHGAPFLPRSKQVQHSPADRWQYKPTQRQSLHCNPISLQR